MGDCGYITQNYGKLCWDHRELRRIYGGVMGGLWVIMWSYGGKWELWSLALLSHGHIVTLLYP